MSSQIGIWSTVQNRYLSEEKDESGVYLIDNRPWAYWVKTADARAPHDFVKQRETVLFFSKNSTCFCNL